MDALNAVWKWCTENRNVSIPLACAAVAFLAGLVIAW